MAGPGLVPELDVSDLAQSLEFYVGLIGFAVRYERPEERFAYLTLDRAHLMLEEAEGPGRRFRRAPLERPYGRGATFRSRSLTLRRFTSGSSPRGSSHSCQSKSAGIVSICGEIGLASIRPS